MQNSLDFLEDIQNKYIALESGLDQALRKIQIEEQKVEKQFPTVAEKKVTIDICHNLDTSKHRNNSLIKELEVSKARLRSKAIYSPLEQVLGKAIGNYCTNPSLLPITSNSTVSEAMLR